MSSRSRLGELGRPRGRRGTTTVDANHPQPSTPPCSTPALWPASQKEVCGGGAWGWALGCVSVRDTCVGDTPYPGAARALLPACHCHRRLAPPPRHPPSTQGRSMVPGGRTDWARLPCGVVPAPCLCPAGPPWPSWPVGAPLPAAGLGLDVVLAPAVLAIPLGICPCPLGGPAGIGSGSGLARPSAPHPSP